MVKKHTLVMGQKRIWTVVLILALVLALIPPARPVQAAIYTVNSTDNVDDGTCDKIHCSLREAINAANSHLGADTITFHITSGCGADGVCTIRPSNPLPDLTDNGTTIDGYSQPGASLATTTTLAVLKIEIDGTNAGASANGLRLYSSDNSISGLMINRFSWSGVFITSGATGNIVFGNYIGTDANSTAGLGNTTGVSIRGGAQNNAIGGNTPSKRNVISGNGGSGVWIYDSDTMSNTVSGNYIGTNVSATAVLSNTGHGIAIGGGAQNNTIGPGNLIAYNSENGVFVYEDPTGNAITQNSIFSNAMGINLQSGTNGNIAAPVIITTTAGSVNIVGTVWACPGCTVEVFANSNTDGEGETYIGNTTATAGGAFTVTVSFLSDPYLTATATDAISGTSEFSAVFTSTVTGGKVYLPIVLKNS